MKRLVAGARQYVAVVVSGFALAACSSALPQSSRHACLKVNVFGAVVPVDGYPVGVVDDAWRRRGGSVRMDGADVLVLTGTDVLTKRSLVIKLQVEPGNRDLRTDQCGPESLVVTRMSVGRQEFSGLDMRDQLSALVQSGAQQLGVKAPKMPGEERSAAGDNVTSRQQPGVGAPAPPITLIPQGSSSLATGQPSNPTAEPEAGARSAEYAACMKGEDARAQLPAALKECASDELARQDHALNVGYHATLARLDPGRQQALRQEEQAWLVQNATVCPKATGAAGQASDDLAYTKCILDRTGERIRQLDAFR